MIEKFSVDHLSELAAYACRKNASRESGSAFCCQTEASIQRDFSETLDFGFACREGDRLCGLLSCFPDLEKGNVDCALLADRENYSATARKLLSAAQAQLGNHLRYTFFFPKENEACAAFLESIGACRRENEYRMVLRRDDWQPQEGLPAPHPLEEAAYAAFVALHDRVFPDVYVSGRDILEDLGKSRFVYTLEEAGSLAAYGVLHRAEDRNPGCPAGAAGAGIWPGHSELPGKGDVLQTRRSGAGSDCRCRQHPGPEPISKDWLSNPRRKPMLYFTIKNCS